MKKIFLISINILLLSSLNITSTTLIKGDNSASEAQSEAEINVYPKLTEGILYIEGLEDNELIIVENNKGEDYAMKQELYNGYKIINLKDYPNGIYTIKVKRQSFVYEKKIVKH